MPTWFAPPIVVPLSLLLIVAVVGAIRTLS
jgi:hypothetical protein